MANGQSTKPTKYAIAQTTPFAAPRMRVGKTSAVSTVLGPQKPRKPKLQSRPKTQSSTSLSVNTHSVRKMAPSSNVTTNPTRRPTLSASQPETTRPRNPARPQNT